jgi:hypothetical protein
VLAEGFREELRLSDELAHRDLLAEIADALEDTVELLRERAARYAAGRHRVNPEELELAALVAQAFELRETPTRTTRLRPSGRGGSDGTSAPSSVGSGRTPR